MNQKKHPKAAPKRKKSASGGRSSTGGRVALGLDFGTESVRALLVDLAGTERGSAVAPYRHGQIVERLPGTEERLPADFALQDPRDWLDSAARAVRQALRQSGLAGQDVLSLGVDFTSCTMLPTTADGTPLCTLKEWSGEKYAWPKLWKHHGAKTQTERLNRVARDRGETWLPRYGGLVGLEWFFPKVWETVEAAPKVHSATDVWLEAGDWFVWQLVGGPASQLPRSTCQAGYKALWHARDGYPTSEFLGALDRRLRNVVSEKMPGRLLPPGEAAGELCDAAAQSLGLRPGITVSAATIDAHAGVPGAGVAEPNTLVMVLGTSSCHMLNAPDERAVPGIAGVVEGGILPGLFGYETGQAAVGDAFDWVRRLCGARDFAALDRAAAELPPGADGVLCVDWFNGCRTPLMDGSLTGSLSGLALRHGPEHVYRSLIEATGFGLRWIVDVLEEGGVAVRKFVATGGLPHHNPLLVQVYADILGRPITVHPSQHGPAQGAAILGVLAAGKRATGFTSASAAVRAMAGESPSRPAKIVKPNRAHRRAYDELYKRYRVAALLNAGSGE